MTALLTGRAFTYAILMLYALRCMSYVYAGSWGRAVYWLGAIVITTAAEFMVARWP